ncbi:MAG: IS110 family transposase [Ardenticatenaceae bacterium]|nr:IS110 family transposase [Ardenticatenaceae bacterium]
MRGTHGAGVEVHTKTIVVGCLTAGPDGTGRRETRTFGTTTSEVVAVSEWLTSRGITPIAMESTGEDWKPVSNLLAANCEVLGVKAAPRKHVPGRKTDGTDAEWIAELLRPGLLRASFMPPLAQRARRDLTRQRTILVQERAAGVNRLQKGLEWADLKLSGVVTDVVGVSARAMLAAIVDGPSDVALVAELARGRVRRKRAEREQALDGHGPDHHRCLMAQPVTHVDFRADQMAACDPQITALIEAQSPPADPPAAREAQALTPAAPPEPTPDVEGAWPWAEAVAIGGRIPGSGRRVADIMVAAIGTAMRRFPAAAHLARWAKLAPGHNERAGKRPSGRIATGHLWLRSALLQAAQAAVNRQDSFLGACSRRLVARRGVKQALVAVAQKRLTTASPLLCTREHSHERGAEYLDERRTQRRVNRLRHDLETLGYTVSLEPVAALVA